MIDLLFIITIVCIWQLVIAAYLVWRKMRGMLGKSAIPIALVTTGFPIFIVATDYFIPGDLTVLLAITYVLYASVFSIMAIFVESKGK